MAERRVGALSWILFWGLALGGCAFDLATKHLVFSRMALGQVKTIVDDVFELHTSHNTGALWGFGSWLPHSSLFFAILSIVAALGILWWLFVAGAARDLRLCVALGLVMAGAMGNCFDRLKYGYVRDFMHLHFEWGPLKLDSAIFNFADNMLIAGALGIMWIALRSGPEPTPAPVVVDAAEPNVGEPAGQTS